MFDKYQVNITFTRELLGTNPLDPHVHDKHIIKKQRDLILENANVKKAVDRYLNAKTISDERATEEVNRLFNVLEQVTKCELTDAQKQLVLAEGISALDILIPELNQGGTTVFFRDDEGNPQIGDHMIYGYLKAAGEALCDIRGRGKNGTFLGTKAATCSKINTFVNVADPFISLHMPEGAEVILYQRSLRVETAKGPRVCLATSEVVPAGTTMEFVVMVAQGCGISEQDMRDIFAFGECKGFGQWRNSGRGKFTYTMKKLG